MPRSHSPLATACAAGRMYSGIADRLLAVGAEVLHLVPEREEKRLHLLFVGEAGVIGTEGNFHGKVNFDGTAGIFNISLPSTSPFFLLPSNFPP